MSNPSETRIQRQHGDVRGKDPRTSFQIDRDRLMYTSGLRRLGDVTQVISPQDYTFHNRLTHTYEVAQIGRRMAEYIVKGINSQGELERLHHMDPDVVEAACFLHDLGHPPFGHVAEEQLDKLSAEAGGFEGNAQSFRIATRLALHSDRYLGLNLTRATLNAVLKYPWTRAKIEDNPKRHRKFGAYPDDTESFYFARDGSDEQALEPRSLEAQVMDHADAIAYAIHDLVDFFRAGLLPLNYLMTEENIYDFLTKIDHKSEILPDSLDLSLEDVADYLVDELSSKFPFDRPYDGSRQQQFELYRASSVMIGRYTANHEVNWASSSPILKIDPFHELEINFLKRLIWHYVINRPQLGTQQYGMKHVIRYLFNAYQECINGCEGRLIPDLFKEEYDNIINNQVQDLSKARIRLATDIVASLSDGQALSLFKRLSGVELGKITDFIGN